MTNRLKTLRNAKNWKQKDLASALDVSQQTVARWESGADIPTKYLRDLSVVLDCEITDLLNEPEPTPTASVVGPSHEDYDFEDPTPFGDLVVTFMPVGSSSTVTTVNLPITVGVRSKVYYWIAEVRMQPNYGWHQWLYVRTLDKRIVFIDLGQVQSLELVSDMVEAMSPYAHDEVYRIARALVLTGSEPDDVSEKLVHAAQKLIEHLGGTDSAEAYFECIKWQYSSGIEDSALLRAPAVQDLDLIFMFSTLDCTPTSFLKLGDESDPQSKCLRLGALRMIEVPEAKFDEIQDV